MWQAHGVTRKILIIIRRCTANAMQQHDADQKFQQTASPICKTVHRLYLEIQQNIAGYVLIMYEKSQCLASLYFQINVTTNPVCISCFMSLLLSICIRVTARNEATFCPCQYHISFAQTQTRTRQHFLETSIEITKPNQETLTEFRGD